jgi:hypothetical protein
MTLTFADEMMSRRRKIILFVILLLFGILFTFRDSLHTACSAYTKTPRNWIKESSPMRVHMEYLWDHWDEEGIESSTPALVQL